jgi:23S rRNA (adenine2503-C2)-methyltransferase
MSNLSKSLIACLEGQFIFSSFSSVVIQEAKDGTTKYLFELSDEHLIETVLMRQKYGLSVCVTTQVGCRMGCSFCASGLLVKQRDLTIGEMVAQVMQVQHFLDEKGCGERVSHVVVMGIGEPFDNYDNVLSFLRIINDDKGLAIGARHITVSTSGLAPKIYEFAHNGLQVNLAISLHAPNNEIRSEIMQINRAIPIEKLFEAIDFYMQTTNRRVTFEYILLSGVNDSVQNACELTDLLKEMKKLAYVNLIPYNSVSEHVQYQRSSTENMLRFYDVLKKKGINCVIRQECGTDIDAACGQLRVKQLGKKEVRRKLIK